MPNKILLTTVKQHAFQEKSQKRNFGVGRSVNLHVFSLAQNHTNIFLMSLWDRSNIYSIISLLNTQRLQSLFDLLSTKERIKLSAS